MHVRRPRRLQAALLSGFAGLALPLACAGIYGVTSYLVGGRTQEMGIRMALGARRRDIFGLVVGGGIKRAIIGICIGVLGTGAITRFISSLLYGVTANDPLTLAAVSFLLVLTTALACYIPARRAAKVRSHGGVAV